MGGGRRGGREGGGRGGRQPRGAGRERHKKKVTVGKARKKSFLRVLDPEPGRRLEVAGGGAGVAGSREGLEGRRGKMTKKR